MLNDFVGEKAPLRCPGGEKIIPDLQKLFAWVRERNARGLDDVQLVHIQEAHRKMMLILELDQFMQLKELGVLIL
ncbi:hypothetical protein Q5M85_16135 [Paraclostridium bifermentans]|nr:hypothetical protein [Paraclostridium bifermentans]